LDFVQHASSRQSKANLEDEQNTRPARPSENSPTSAIPIEKPRIEPSA
jgi:hypothetical protein